MDSGMTKKMVQMAQEAGLHLSTDANWMPIIDLAYAYKFAAVVAAEEAKKWESVVNNMAKLMEAQQNREGVSIDMIAAAIKAEREACADTARTALLGVEWSVTERVLKAIRARGQT